MGLIDQLKTAGEQVAAGARETVQEAQLRHDLAEAYGELGRVAFGLLEEGALADGRLAPGSRRIRELQTQLGELATEIPATEPTLAHDTRRAKYDQT